MLRKRGEKRGTPWFCPDLQYSPQIAIPLEHDDGVRHLSHSDGDADES